jgi:hypothetical protein
MCNFIKSSHAVSECPLLWNLRFDMHVYLPLNTRPHPLEYGTVSTLRHVYMQTSMMHAMVFANFFQRFTQRDILVMSRT